MKLLIGTVIIALAYWGLIMMNTMQKPYSIIGACIVGIYIGMGMLTLIERVAGIPMFYSPLEKIKE